MNSFKQLLMWPPKTSTVIGAGLVVGAIDYGLTHNVVEAVTLAGLFKMVCPEDATAADKVTDLINKLSGDLK